MKKTPSLSAKKLANKPRPAAIAQALEPRVLFSADIAAASLATSDTQPTAQVQNQPASPAASNSPQQTLAQSQLFVIDLRIADAQGLLLGLEQQQVEARARGEIFEILKLDWQDDGITKIRDAVTAQGNVSAVHLIGHGDDGMMLLGSTWLDQATLRSRATDFATWSNGLTSDADILIYGCDFAGNETGQQSVRSLAQITGADVAASVDSTSNISNGGNWVLEVQQGSIEANTTNVERAATNWQAKLATFVVTNNSDSGAGSLRQAITDANNTSGADAITFNIGGPGVQDIALQSALPQITEGVLIDGTTVTGYAVGSPLVVLNGSSAGSPANGIVINSTTPVTIRGLVINRFQGHGIAIFGGGSHTITGNFIGIDYTGNNAFSNGGSGIFVDNSTNNVIGGTTAAERNVISANIDYGILINNNSNGNSVTGNYIGTDATGMAPLGNTFDGVTVNSSSNVTIGGTATGAGNLISGNLQNGIGLYTSGGNNRVLGNSIGLNAAGTAAIANQLSGIAISNSNSNIIGSSVQGGRNTISGNVDNGIFLVDTSNNVIKNNWIGRNSTNTANVGNNSGVAFDSGATNNRLGGFGINEGNVIAGSVSNGVVSASNAIQNAIVGNSIFASGALGIDLGSDGVTPNDAAPDSDTGANDLQNYPVLYTSTINGALLITTGEFSSAANTQYVIQLYSNPAGTADPTGRGEGTKFIGYFNVTTNALGFATYSTVFGSAGIGAGDHVSAVATVDLGGGAFGNTSEFSQNVIVALASSAPVIGNLDGDTQNYFEGSGVLRLDLSADAVVTDTDSVDFDTGTLNVSFTSGLVASEDILAIQNQGSGAGQISVNGATISYEGIAIGAYSGGTNGTPLTIVFNANANSVSTAGLLHAITYENSNNANPAVNTKTIRFVLADGDGGVSGNADVQVLVNAVNDAPTIFQSTAPLIYAENAPPIFVDPLASIVDVDSANFDGGVLTFSTTANHSSRDVLAINHQGMSAGQIGVIGNVVFYGGVQIGTFSANNVTILVNLNSSATAIATQAILRNFTFSITGNDPESNTRTFGYSLSDGDGGLTVSSSKSITISVDNVVWVTTANDAADGDISSIFNLLANRGADGAISLREAIIATNNTVATGQNQINFDIAGAGVHRINLASTLPKIVNTVTIEGRTQAGYTNTPLIEINGSAISNANGLELSAGSSGSTIRGLSIINFLGNGAPGGHGILITSNSNIIQSNYIGLDGSGNVESNWVGLVVTDGAQFNLVGGSAAGQGNVIAGNTLGGISLGGVGTSFNRIEGNFIGVAADGITTRPNVSYGINVWATGDGNSIGGTPAGAGNIISANQNVGIVVDPASTVAVLGNSISGNASIGIDLGNNGLTLNDLNDADSGANGLQNYPIISSVTSSGGFTTIIGNFNSTPSQTFRLEYFSSPAPDATGYGGGKTLIGYSTIITGTDGNANINLTLGSVSVPIGHYVSATATRDFGSIYGGTSEFGRSVIVNSVFPGATVSTTSGTVTSESGTSVTFTVRLNTAPTGTVTIPISSDKFWEANVNTSALVFTAANWNIAQTVTVTGVDDSVIDGSHGYNIVFGDAVSTDPAYNSMKLADIALNNIDDDTRSVIVVNTTADIADGDTSSLYALIRNLGADGKISLREAIQAANNTPNGVAGADEIQFNISDALVNGEHVIQLSSELPAITDPIFINGSSEPDWGLNANRPVIVIDGNDLIAPIFHLTAPADNSAITSLIIRNSGREGILIDAGSDNNHIYGNYIGNLRSDGTSTGAALGNTTGIDIRGATNTIGGVSLASRNVISGNSQGIVIQGASAIGNLVVGNYIGTTSSGNIALSNTSDGVRIQAGATSNIVGGATAAERNVISGNLNNGVLIDGEATDNNTIQGNYIGVSADGLSNITPTSNVGSGIYIFGGADSTLVGGGSAGQGNWIAGAYFGGVVVDGTSTNTVIQGNRIGTDATGTLNWGVGFNSVLLRNGAASTLVGGTSALSRNILANNGQRSTFIESAVAIIGTGINNTVLGNSIYGNAGLSIDLGADGVTNNDSNDVDNGVNGLQNFPSVSSALSVAGTTTIVGSLNSNANTNYRIEFFSSPIPGSPTFNEARTYLGFANITTDGSGNASFNVTLNGVTLNAGDFVMGTATVDFGGGSFGSTSELSLYAPANIAVSISGTVFEDINSNGQVSDDGVGLAGAIVSLYRDNGDGVIGAGDTIINSVNANSSGQYSFNNLANGTYWVVVDSRSFRSNSGLMPTATTLDQWAEQTYGSAGSVSWNGNSYAYSSTSGAMFGGMRYDRSDNGASLPTAEHVTRVNISGASVGNVDYGFSYDAITNTRDGDDVAANNLSIQGSLRQFVQNSNALLGRQSSQFRIPSTDLNVAAGVSVVSLTSALPTLTDSVDINGTTQTFWIGDTNSRVLGTGGSVGYNPVGLSTLKAPEIEIRDLTSSPNIFKILGDNTIIRGLSILGGGVANNSGNAAIEVSANNVTISGNIIGSSATAIADPGAANRIQSVGIRVLGQTTIDNNIFAYIPLHAISVEAGGSNSAIYNNEFISPALTSNTQAAIAVRDVSNVQINGNLVRNSGGNAIELYFNADNNFIRNNSFVNGGGLPGGDDNAIDITGGSDGNVIEGNAISGNSGTGIFVSNSVNNRIGGVLPDQSNQIINNLGAGIALVGATTGNNAILGNSIDNNGGLGIDLGNDGVTANDGALDADIGPNGLLNFPVLTSVNASGGNTLFQGSFQSTANSNFRIEFFTSPTADPSGHGGGSALIGAVNVLTDATGQAVFNLTRTGWTLANGSNVTATATVNLGTGSYGNTSEFSQNIVSTSGTPGINVSAISGNTSEAGGVATFTVVLNSQPSSDVTISFRSDNLLEGIVSTNSLTFTSTNWNVAQTVTVTGVNEQIVDGDRSYAIILGSTRSADSSYNGINFADINVVNIDNDTQSTITVTTTNDVNDGDTSSLYALQSNKGADGVISLREAIIAANNSTNGPGGADKIYFNIADPLINAAHTINLNSALPLLTDSVIIDGYSEPDSAVTPSSHVVVIDGANIGPVGAGLVITSTASDSTIRGLVIHGFNWHGIEVQLGSNNNTITGNYIGQLTATGTDAGPGKAIGGSGIYVEGYNNTIGGVTAADRNVVSGNYVGINLQLGTNNLIIGNYIGTNAAGTTAIANRDSGIYGQDTTGNVIGGTALGMGNLISGNVKSGIYLFNSANNTSIQGNYIGTDSTGAFAIGNNSAIGSYFAGITIENASGTLIGGTAVNAGNVISGNNGNGILSIVGGTANLVVGNLIGLSADGQSALGNSGNGIQVETSNLRIGGSTVADRNFIAGNLQSGILFTGAGANNNVVSGNFIGTDTTGLIGRGNQGAGVQFSNGASNNLIGSPVASDANKIAFNGAAGILVSNTGTVSRDNAFLGNQIFGNNGLGIDLAPNGVNNNDLGDIDVGANDLQNFPVLTTVVSSGGNTTITGTFNSTANRTFLIEYFSSSTSASSGHGDATTAIGSMNITTNAAGNANFSHTFLGVSLPIGHIVTATATHVVSPTQFGSTSEFSQNVAVVAALPGISISSPTSASTSEAGTTSQFSVVLDSAPTANVTITIASSDTSEGTVSTNLLTFTAANWNIPQIVTITGVNDSFIDGTQAYTILIGTALSSDPNYNGKDTPDIFMSNADNDTFNSIVVDTTADITDGDSSSIAALYANKGSDGKISLREAILAANNTANGTQRDNIYFDIADPLIAGQHTINLASVLPIITEALGIDGTTEPDYTNSSPVIELVGSTPSVSSGLRISANDSRVTGLIINRFGLSGILVAAADAVIANNVISAIGGYGITITGNNATIVSNTISNNSVAAIYVSSPASNANVTSNSISNEAIGVGVEGTATGVLISQNTMTNVAQLIDLGFDGVTPNDFNDSDLGPNGLQNTPIISSVLTDGSTQIRVTGSFTGAANKTLTVELYEHGALGQSARSQFVGTLSISADASGYASFTQTFFGNYLAGTLFSATATDVTVPNNRSTSEHSAAIAASLSTVIVTPIAGLVVNESGSTANFSLSLSTAPTSDVVITLSTSIAGEISLSTNTITFTTQNWNIAQVVTITGLQDFFSDGTKSLFVITSQTTSTDPRYNGLTVSDVAVSNQEVANVAPTISAPLSYSITEDVPANLGGISTGLVISDVDAGSNLLSVTLSTSNGIFSLGSLAGITFSTGDGNADPVTVFQGTTSAINAAINTIAFTPTLNFFGTASFSITVNDLGNSGSGGALSATRVVPINVAPVNDAPVLLGTRTASVVEAGSVLISSTMLSLADVDTTSSDLVFTIKAIDAEGEFMRSGVSLRAGDSFTQAEINSQLIQYVHFGGELPTATVTLGASERFGLALADFNLVFSVVAVNDAPTITGVSNAQVLEISNLGTPVATVSASDPDNPTGLTFSLSNNAQGAFQINATTGAISVLNPALIDYETATQLAIRVKVADQLGAFTERDLVVQVLDVTEFVLQPPGGGGSGNAGNNGNGTSGTGTTGGGNTGSGTTTDSNPTNNGGNTGGSNTGTGKTDVINQTTTPSGTRTDAPTSTAQNSEARRGSQVRLIENDRDVLADSNAPTTSQKKQSDGATKVSITDLLEQQEAYSEKNRRRQLNTDVLDLLLNSSRKDKALGLVIPQVVLGDFKLPDNAVVSPIREDLIDNSRPVKTFNVVIDTIEYSGIALSAGAVVWATRTGGLLAALLSAIPAWKGLDPLLVLSPSKSQKQKQFEEFSDTEIRSDEEAVRAVL